jgi:stress-induced morphogen
MIQKKSLLLTKKDNIDHNMICNEENIRAILEKAFHNPICKKIMVNDFSKSHKNHHINANNGGTHIEIIIVWDGFIEFNLIQRHRMVYASLDLWKDGLHALTIKALTEKEYDVS